MPVRALDISKPFFRMSFVSDESRLHIAERAILLNLSDTDIAIEQQVLHPLCSTIVQNVELKDVERAVVITGFEQYSDREALFDRVRATWPSAFEVRGEERLSGVSHYMSPKTWIDNIGLTLYHSGSVPLNVGLHKDHPFCPVPGFREVHTQIIGYGKMQQCRERDLATLYLEEPMAPGTTHRPMYDEDGNYPWHQYETITPSIFLAVEILPDGADIPGSELNNG